MESYPLAEAFYATGQPDQLKGYERLLELGSSSALRDWIRTGASDVGLSADSTDAETRARTVIEVLEAARVTLDGYGNEFKPDSETWELPPRGMEIAALMNGAVNDLIAEVSAADTETTGTGIQVDV